MGGSRLKVWLRELRAPFFAASALPVLLGASAALGEGVRIHLPYLFLTLLGAVSLHGGANVLNDYFDFLSGNDLLYPEQKNPPFDGGSPFLVQGILTPQEVYRFALFLLALGGAIGLFLAYRRGWPILALGAFGLFCSYFYVEPRLNLAGRGWGELAVGLSFGPLSVLGAYFVQAQRLAPAPLMASLPLGLLITNVLFLNQFPDLEADQKVGKTHWVVRLGRNKATRVFVLLSLSVYLLIGLGIALRLLPPASLLGLLTLPLCLRVLSMVRRHYADSPRLKPAQALTILNHLLTGLLLCLAYLI
ncbi:MAG: prenyltransferase [candidate division NC10 bacterium]|nr:prenyltransferase [candidate division NC10 bacterium]